MCQPFPSRSVSCISIAYAPVNSVLRMLEMAFLGSVRVFYAELGILEFRFQLLANQG